MENSKKYNIKKNTDGYGNVRVGIVKQAITDYKEALIYDEFGKARALERWFLSEWGEALSGGNGAYIIEKVRKELGKGCYR